MNIFRLAGDMSHLASLVLLYQKIAVTRSCRGISLKTVELYALVFILRYLDLFTSFISLCVSAIAAVDGYEVYNTGMKVLFISVTLAVIYQMRYKISVKTSYDKERDTFRSSILVGSSALIALFLHERIHGAGWIHFFVEIAWQTSIYLEAVAILPQLTLLVRTENIDNLTTNYVALLGAYRALYILNWIYRWATERHYFHLHVWLAGIVQTVLYGDFFYYYFKSWQRNERLKLPA